MGNSRRDDDEAPDALWDDGLRAAFEPETEDGGPRSVIDTIERIHGTRPGILLRDAADDETPVLAVPDRQGSDAVRDDSRYQIHGEIARGGVGVVYKGRDGDLGRDVALKVLRSDHAGNPDMVERFVEEAQVGGQLQHPGIVPVYGLEVQPDGRPYFAMKLVKGRTLSALLEARGESGHDSRDLLSIFEQVCLTVAYAHARGVVHRDLKPANVMIGAFGEVHVVDWGFAKVRGREDRARRKSPDVSVIATVRSGEGSHSVDGSVMGTPAYMPPEQALGQIDDLDERTDVFALGAVLTEILTGKPPYTGQGNDVLVMAARAQLDDAWTRLDECGADPDLVALAKRYLSPQKKDRPANAGVVAAEIAAHLAAVEERAVRAESEAAEARAEQAEARARLAAEKLKTERAKAGESKARIQAKRERENQKAERRRAQFELRARLRTRAVALILVATVLVGGGAWAWYARSAGIRSLKAEAEVARALRRSAEHEGAGDLVEAKAAAGKAVVLASEAGPKTHAGALEVLNRVEEEKRASEAEAALAAKDEEMVRRLLEVRSRHGESFSKSKLEADYVAAFAAYGLDPEKDPAGAKARIHGRPPDVVTALVDALDEWAWNRSRMSDMEKNRWFPLLRVSRALDRDPQRTLLRDALEGGDSRAVLALLTSEDACRMSPRTILFADRLDPWDLLEKGNAPMVRVALLESAWRRNPGDPMLSIRLSGMPAKYGDTGISFATAALALCPGNATWRVAVARALSKKGESDPQEVLDYIRRAREDGYETGDAHIVQSTDLLRRGDTAQAILMAQRATLSCPDNFSSWMALGMALGASGKYQKALGAFEEARSRYCMCLVLNAIAIAHLELRDKRGSLDTMWLGSNVGHLAAAEKAVLEALDLHSTCVASHTRLIRIYIEGKRYAEALHHAREAYRLEPDDATHQANLGFRLNWLQDQEGAAEHMEEAVRTLAFHPKVANRLALYLMDLGEFNRAIAHLERILVAHPDYHPAWNNLGVAHHLRGEREDALACYRKAAALEPDHPIFLGNIGGTLMETGKFPEAFSAYRKCLAALEKTRESYTDADRARWSPDWIREARRCERMIPLAGSLDAILRGERTPQDAHEALDFAALCHIKGHDLAAARFYEEAFTADPTVLAEPDGSHHLGSAAGVAIAVGFGTGEDVDPAERARWRARALGWLREILARRTKELPGADQAARIELRRKLWALGREEFRYGIRDESRLAELPSAEADAWRTLFADVKKLIDRSLEFENQPEEDGR